MTDHLIIELYAHNSQAKIYEILATPGNFIPISLVTRCHPDEFRIYYKEPTQGYKMYLTEFALNGESTIKDDQTEVLFEWSYYGDAYRASNPAYYNLDKVTPSNRIVMINEDDGAKLTMYEGFPPPDVQNESGVYTTDVVLKVDLVEIDHSGKLLQIREVETPGRTEPSPEIELYDPYEEYFYTLNRSGKY